MHTCAREVAWGVDAPIRATIHVRESNFLTCPGGLFYKQREARIEAGKHRVGVIGGHVDDAAQDYRCVWIALSDSGEKAGHVRNHLIQRVALANIIGAQMNKYEIGVEGQPVLCDAVNLRYGPSWMTLVHSLLRGDVGRASFLRSHHHKRGIACGIRKASIAEHVIERSAVSTASALASHMPRGRHGDTAASERDGIPKRENLGDCGRCDDRRVGYHHNYKGKETCDDRTWATYSQAQGTCGKHDDEIRSRRDGDRSI